MSKVIVTDVTITLVKTRVQTIRSEIITLRGCVPCNDNMAQLFLCKSRRKLSCVETVVCGNSCKMLRFQHEIMCQLCKIGGASMRRCGECCLEYARSMPKSIPGDCGKYA